MKESPLALDLFADDFETSAFQTLGFYCATDFLALAERLGVLAPRAERLLGQYLDQRNHQRVDELITRSFLSPAAKDEYRAIVASRRNALAQRS